MTEQNQDLPSPDSETPTGAAEILAALASREPMLEKDIAACLARYDEIAPALREALRHAATVATLPTNQLILLNRGLCVLALMRDSDTCKLLLQLLRHQAPHEPIPIGLLVSLTRLIANVFDGDRDALFTFAVDRSLHPHHRVAALEAAIFLTWKGTISRDTMTDFLKSFPADTTLDREIPVVGTWIAAIALLGLRDLAPMVYHRMTIGPIGDLVPDRPTFDDLLDNACKDPTYPERLQMIAQGEVHDVTDALAEDMSSLDENMSLDEDMLLDEDMPRHGNDRAQQGRGPSLEEIMLELATAPYCSPEIIDACRTRKEEITPALFAVVTSADSAAPLSEARRNFFCRCLCILAALRDTRLCQPLLRMLKRTDRPIHPMIKGISAEMSSILPNVFDWDSEPLLDLVADSAIAPELRAHLLDAATYLTFKGPISRDRMQRFLSDFDVHSLTRQDQFPLIASWIRAIALLGLRDLAPLVELRVNVADLENLRVLRESGEFQAMLTDAEKYPYSEERFFEYNIGRIDEAFSILMEYSAQRVSSPAPPRATAPTPPTVVWRNVGRNDPCPCGSGRKAKKCCLANRNP